MDNVTKHMTASEVRALIGRLMVKCDDLKRRKELVSVIAREAVIKRNGSEYSHARQEEQDDLNDVVLMLDNELCRTREAVRELKAIYKRRAAQLALSVV